MQDVARRLDTGEDAIGKQLRVLRDARLIVAVTPTGVDRRKQLYELPALLRSRDITGRLRLDIGWVMLRF